MPELLRIYVAGPVNTITEGEKLSQLANIRRMVAVGDHIIRLGMSPVLPAINGLHHLLSPQSRDYWMAMCREEIRRSDACFRIMMRSSGADEDVAYAQRMRKPIFDTYDDLGAWGRQRNPYAHVCQTHGKSLDEVLRYPEEDMSLIDGALGERRS